MKPRIGAIPARFRRNRIRAAAVALFAAGVPTATVLALQSPEDPTSPFETFSSFSSEPSHTEVRVASDADGDAVVVYTGRGEEGDGDDRAIRVLKIDAHGRFIAPDGSIDDTGTPQLVNTTTSGAQFSPDVAMDRDGDFVVVWQGGEVDSAAYDIFFQRFDRSFNPVGDEVQVTTHGLRQSMTRPTVAMDGDGDFVVAWSDSSSLYGISAQKFLADGTPLDDPFDVPTQTGYSQTAARAAMDADGDFAIVWASSGQDGSGYGVYARAFASDGTARGSEFRVNTVTTLSQNHPDIAMDRDGDFVVAWDDETGPYYFTTVNFQRYDAAGAAVGGNVTALDNPGGDERRPAVSMAANGDYVITWTDYSADPPPLGSEGFTPGIVARRFTKDGKPIAAEFRVNATTADTESDSDIALDADSDMAIAYIAQGGNGILSGPLMLFRRFTGNEPVDVVVREVAPASTDVAVDTAYQLELTIKNRHTTSAVTGIGTATGVAVDLVSNEGTFLGIAQPGWECGTAFFCTAAGFCLTCVTNEIVPPGGTLNLTVNLQAPPDVGTASTSVGLDINQADPAGRNNGIEVQRTIVPPDDLPDPFPFQNQADVPLSTVVTSAPFVVSGINVPAAISVASGRYSVNGGAFTDQPGTVVAGDSIVARHRSSDTVLTAITTRVTVGGEVARFRSVTEAADTTPDPFAFGAVNDAPVSTQQVSNPVTVTGINQATPISVAGGQYSVDGRAYTADAGSVKEGDVVTVRRKSSSQGSTTVTATLTIGGVSADFDVTTEVVADQSPDPFSFASQTGVPVSSVRVSNPITVQGINTATPIGVEKGLYRVNDGSFTSTSGTVEPGDTVVVQQTSSASPSTDKTTTLTIGDRAGTFTTTTAAPDTQPNP
ncbi:MAG TPA: hypothetical protein VJM11_03985, partial [Nevskiaceae bacterium]|nr:hypothetical protein [Nevskiaceae bacterium]